MTKLVSKWNYPTTVRFGAGRIKELPDTPTMLELSDDPRAQQIFRYQPAGKTGRAPHDDIKLSVFFHEWKIKTKIIYQFYVTNYLFFIGKCE